MTLQLRKPYLLLVGDETDATYAKTACGIAHWCPDDVAGQLRFSEAAVDLGVPDMSIEAAVAQGVGSLNVGVAPIGAGLALKRLSQTGGRVLLHDPRGTLGTDNTLVQWMLRVTLDVTDFTIAHGHANGI